MSKKARKGRPTPEPALESVTASASESTAPAMAATAESTSWIDSPDPRKRRMGRIILGVVWVYVAALWLLALDQWFNWGIFGPTVPPAS